MLPCLRYMSMRMELKELDGEDSLINMYNPLLKYFFYD